MDEKKEIERLRKENEKLKEELEKIKNTPNPEYYFSNGESKFNSDGSRKWNCGPRVKNSLYER